MNLHEVNVSWFLVAILVAGTTLNNRQALSATFSDGTDLPSTTSSLLNFLDRNKMISGTVSGKLLAVTVKHSPEHLVWTGQKNGDLFAAAVRTLPLGPAREQAEPAFMRFIQAKMISEVLKTKSIVDTYAKYGLTETDALIQAVEITAGQLNFAGSLKGFLSKASVEGDCVVGYLFVNEANVIARLQEVNEMNKVRASYQMVLHARMRKHMKKEQWEAALETWGHLEGLDLLSQELFSDAVSSAFNVGANEMMLDMIDTFTKRYQNDAKPKVLEEIGDVAIKVNTPRAQKAAASVYKFVLRLRMSYTTSGYTSLMELP